jgi:hypothetical protein
MASSPQTMMLSNRMSSDMVQSSNPTAEMELMLAKGESSSKYAGLSILLGAHLPCGMHQIITMATQHSINSTYTIGRVVNEWWFPFSLILRVLDHGGFPLTTAHLLTNRVCCAGTRMGMK